MSVIVVGLGAMGSASALHLSQRAIASLVSIGFTARRTRTAPLMADAIHPVRRTGKILRYVPLLLSSLELLRRLGGR